MYKTFFKKIFHITLLLVMVIGLGFYRENIKSILSQVYQSVITTASTTQNVLAKKLFNTANTTPIEVELPKLINTTTETDAIQKESIKKPTDTKTQFYKSHEAVNTTNILAIINYERNISGIRSLSFDNELNISAQKKAEDMLGRRYFSHETPGKGDITYFIDYAGYDFIKVSENLAQGDFRTSGEVVTAWMNSSGHRQNILDTAVIDTGIGIVYGTYQGFETFFVVQHFGRPRGSCPIVDKRLEGEIKASTLTGKNLSTEIKDLQKQVDDILTSNPSSSDRQKAKELSVKVANLIETYNMLVDDITKNTNLYNTQVKAFNECNAKY
jgi:uncharacterized protein YkwD